MNPNDKDDSKPGATRRQFIEGVAAAFVAGGMPQAAAAMPQPQSSHIAPSPNNAASYPPALQGLRGQTSSAMQAGHGVRDGASFLPPQNIADYYDLIVVGAGLSGLAAAYFFRKSLPNSKILILEGCDDFGGHARRNEFNTAGRQVISAGGSYTIMFPSTYSPEGKTLLADIGVKAEPCYAGLKSSAASTAKYDLSGSVFFDSETYGADRLVNNAIDFFSAALGMPGVKPPWESFLNRSPLAELVKRDIRRLMQDHVDFRPGASIEQKISHLRHQSYADFLAKNWNVSHETLAYFQNQFGSGILNVGAGPDSFSAWRAYNAHYPGFAGIGLPPVRTSDIVRDDQITPDIHLPDGNAGVARLLIRWLIPAALPGNAMEDSVARLVDYSMLDRLQQDVRIRLSSTVIRAQHDGPLEQASSVYITYLQHGKTYRVRGGTCVMACFNAVVPYLCTELPDTQKEALHRMVRKPLVATAVGLNNWRAFAKAKTRSIAFPNGFYSHLFLDLGYDLGEYHGARSPEDPAIVLLGYTPNYPGTSARDQYRVGRARIMEYSLEHYEDRAREQLVRALGPSGFDVQRDIAGVTVNRWAHGYACGDNDLFDPEKTVSESSWVVGRKRFGRIVIANSDSAGVSMTQAAFDQANRAVKELLYEVLEPTFYYSNPARG